MDSLLPADSATQTVETPAAGIQLVIPPIQCSAMRRALAQTLIPFVLVDLVAVVTLLVGAATAGSLRLYDTIELVLYAGAPLVMELALFLGAYYLRARRPLALSLGHAGKAILYFVTAAVLLDAVGGISSVYEFHNVCDFATHPNGCPGRPLAPGELALVLFLLALAAATLYSSLACRRFCRQLDLATRR